MPQQTRSEAGAADNIACLALGTLTTFVPQAGTLQPTILLLLQAMDLKQLYWMEAGWVVQSG